MSIKIEKKITSYEVVNDEAKSASQEAPKTETNPEDNIIHMHERVERPDNLLGSTYKVKTPLTEHALYVTINDIVLNRDTPHELRRPFEVFINSKSMDHFQWIVALTRIISAVFRKGGDVTFLVEELRSVFDPRGGYFKKGGKFMPSLVAEIGDVIEQHLREIGMIKDAGLDEHQQRFVDEKRREFEAAATAQTEAATADAPEADSGITDGATLCPKCHTKAMIQMDGCLTCLSCGESKCG